ncbi:alpha/beta-hydrolase [Trametopsis cervina]|nr:alpha/beta-hydrolase [Trametopsis cervina]
MPVLPLHSKELTTPDGLKVFAEAAGDPNKHAILFIHGFAGNGTVYDRQFNDPQLTANFFLVRYDMRGHGRTAHPTEAKDYESLRYAEECKTVCDGFGLVKPSVFAWSLGGCIVVDIIEAYGADYWSSIIYCGGALLTRTLHKDYIHPNLLSSMGDLVSLDASVITAAGIQLIRSIFLNVDETLTYPEYLAFLGSFLLQTPTVRQLTLGRTQESARWEREIGGKKVLVIQGELDMHAWAEKYVEAARKSVGEFELRLLKGVGHTPHLERTEEVNGYILDFVQRTAV